MIDIRQEHLLTLPFRIVGIVLVLAGLIKFSQAMLQTINEQTYSSWTIFGLLLSSLGALLVTVHYRLRIHPGQKWLQVDTWLLGYRKGTPTKFEWIENIFINRVKQSQRVSSFTGHPHQVEQFLFKAYLKLDNGEKVHLDTDEDEQKLAERVQQYKIQLGETYRGL